MPDVLEGRRGAGTLVEADDILAGTGGQQGIGNPPGATTVGREAIRAVCERMLAHAPRPFRVEEALPTVRYGDLALTSTRPADRTGGRVQVARRQPDGTWLRIMDRPEIRAEAGAE
ncbi:SnoaL-like domain-containing protein OS=Streptomyces antimycoticus OX=68175 GN=SANT12839_006460 PE=4 SV=1 [Streptomyces antimycoticus]